MIERRGRFIIRVYEDGHGETIMQYDDGEEQFLYVRPEDMDRVTSVGEEMLVAERRL